MSSQKSNRHFCTFYSNRDEPSGARKVTWVNVMSAFLEMYSANLQANMPQSDPFIWFGIFFTLTFS